MALYLPQTISATGDWINETWGISYPGKVSIGYNAPLAEPVGELTLIGKEGKSNILHFSEDNQERFWKVVKTSATNPGALGTNSLVFQAKKGDGTIISPVVFKAGGRIGFGTSSPQAMLHIVQRNGNAIVIETLSSDKKWNITGSSNDLKINSLNSDYSKKNTSIKINHDGEVCIGKC